MQQEMRFRQESDSEALLERELLPGEQILWSGRPLLNSKNNALPGSVFLTLGIIFGAIGLLMFLLGGFFLILLSSSSADIAGSVLFLIGGIFLCMAIFFAIFAIFFKWSPKHSLYAVTDQRAIIIRSGRTLTVDTYNKSDISHITRVEHQDGSGDLIFAPARSNFGYGSYGSGYQGNGAGANSANIYGMGSGNRFIGIPNVRDVEHMLRGSSRL